ncbi:hypothetical protein ACWC5I_28120, partial [Kitasatospora sp. NPDC001574]
SPPRRARAGPPVRRGIRSACARRDRRHPGRGDTVGLAVPERDLWSVGADADDLARYAEATGHTPRPAALALYRLRWALEDVDAYLHWFRSPHTGSEDARDSWAALAGTVRELAASV